MYNMSNMYQVLVNMFSQYLKKQSLAYRLENGFVQDFPMRATSSDNLLYQTLIVLNFV